MVGPALRMAGTWVVTTALIVIGVDAAIERAARDVTISRPAPMTRAEVDEELREHVGATTTREVGPTSTNVPGTTSRGPVSSSPTTGTSVGGEPRDPRTTAPDTTRPTDRGPDVTRRDPADDPSSGAGVPSTTSGDSPGGPDGHGGTPRP